MHWDDAQLVPIRFFDGWVMAEWSRRWLEQWAARGVSKILGSLVQHWHPPHERIRS